VPSIYNQEQKARIRSAAAFSFIRGENEYKQPGEADEEKRAKEEERENQRRMLFFDLIYLPSTERERKRKR
jgi:hypothetical protein